jgi:hypothetical protein
MTLSLFMACVALLTLLRVIGPARAAAAPMES